MPDMERLIVDIMRVFDISLHPSRPESIDSDIYVKCTLMPDKQIYSTKSVKMTANPLFEEEFEFKFISTSHLESCHLELSLLETEKSTREETCLGICLIRLNYSNIEMKKTFLKEFKLASKSNEDNYIGEIMFSLAYLTAAERLTIIVMKARNLNGLGLDKKTLPGW